MSTEASKSQPGRRVDESRRRQDREGGNRRQTREAMKENEQVAGEQEVGGAADRRGRRTIKTTNSGNEQAYNDEGMVNQLVGSRCNNVKAGVAEHQR